MVADLAKRAEAERKRRKNQVRSVFLLSCRIFFLYSLEMLVLRFGCLILVMILFGRRENEGNGEKMKFQDLVSLR